MQNYFRSSVIAAGLFLGYDTAFATESEGMELRPSNGLELSLIDAPLREPLPSREMPTIVAENAYLERDQIKDFFNGQKVRNSIETDLIPQKKFKGNPSFTNTGYHLRLLKDSPNQGKLRKSKKGPEVQENTKI